MRFEAVVRLMPAAVMAAALACGGARAADGGPAAGQLVMHTGADVPRDRTVIVGRVARSASTQQPRLEAFADWLATRLGDHGIVAGDGLAARNAREMIAFLRDGKVDVVSESVLTALAYEEITGAEIVRHEWRHGWPYYQSVFITQRASSTFALSDLAGRTIAFENRGSTSGFLLPLAMLIRAGLKPVELPIAGMPVPEGTVGYVFAGSGANISAWVAGGVVQTGAYSNRDWDSNRRTPGHYRDKMRVFHVTEPLLHSVIVLRAGLAPGLRRAILGALDGFMSAHDAPGVRELYYRVTRFDPIEGRAAEDLAEARELYRLVRHVTAGD